MPCCDLNVHLSILGYRPGTQIMDFNYPPPPPPPHVDRMFYFRWIGEYMGPTKMPCPHFGTWSDLH